MELFAILHTNSNDDTSVYKFVYSKIELAWQEIYKLSECENSMYGSYFEEDKPLGVMTKYNAKGQEIENWKLTTLTLAS